MKKSYYILVISLLSFSVFAQPNISLNSVITGLNQPMQFVNAGDGTNRIFIPQKGGEIKVFDRNFALLGTFINVINITTDGERGLLSLCFHPQYKTNGLFFVYYTNSSGDLEVARYQVSSNANVANIASKKIVITVPHPTYGNHNGGTLRFGKDGFLYLSTGDGGSGGDPNNNSQNNNVLLGKMLRLNVNTSNTAPFYTIPAGNPYGNEVLAKGLRNPFRWNFDRLTGDMWIGDVGQSAFEEISHSRRDSLAGVNYGWRCYEGNATYNTTGCLPPSNYRFPVVAYPNPAQGQSVMGGTVYRGETFLAMKGYYLATDFYTARTYKIKFDSTNQTYNISTQTISQSGITDFGESEDGELYATSLFSGSVYRIVSDGPVLQYTFTGNGNWTDAANWSNNTVPSTASPSGSVVVISPISGGECVVNVPITISSGIKIKIDNSKLLRMSSNLTFQ